MKDEFKLENPNYDMTIDDLLDRSKLLIHRIRASESYNSYLNTVEMPHAYYPDFTIDMPFLKALYKILDLDTDILNTTTQANSVIAEKEESNNDHEPLIVPLARIAALVQEDTLFRNEQEYIDSIEQMINRFNIHTNSPGIITLRKKWRKQSISQSIDEA
jgi:hypothetical protein